MELERISDEEAKKLAAKWNIEASWVLSLMKSSAETQLQADQAKIQPLIEQARVKERKRFGEWLELHSVMGIRRLSWLKPTDRIDAYFTKAELMDWQSGKEVQ
jgi:hypothetical protein